MGLFGFGRKGETPTEDREEARFKKPSELQNLIDERGEPYILVDVRTPGEYKSGHIPTASQITHTDIGDTPPTPDKDARIILYCRTGNRSGQARQMLLGMGYQNVTNFGGVMDWPGRLVEGPDPE